jgi:hypothetical protein
MPTITSRVPALIDYLVTLFTNDATLGQASPAVTIYDGPPTTLLDTPLKLFIGVQDPDSEGATEAATSEQEWAALGRRGRDETTIIRCAAEAWTGADDIRTARVAAYGIVSAVETLMQADTSQFGGNVLYPAPGMTGGVLLQNNTDDGAFARVQFDLIFRSRIGG